jgi:hypothetical protein
MQENRTKSRELAFRTGRISGNASVRAIDCAVLNESADGASLLVPRDVPIPKEFTLVIDPNGTTQLCRVVWQKGCRLGVHFVGIPNEHQEDR